MASSDLGWIGVSASRVDLLDNLGAALGAASALIFNVSQSLQTALGGYTNSIQKHVEETSFARKRLASLNGGGSKFEKKAAAQPVRSAWTLSGDPPEADSRDDAMADK